MFAMRAAVPIVLVAGLSSVPAAGRDIRGVEAGEVQRVVPKPIETHLSNPWMGFVYYGGRKHPELADVYYACATWGDLEPQEGKYAWDSPRWNGVIQAAIRRGKRVAIRVPTSWQNTEYPTPKWVFDLGVKRFNVLDKDKPSQKGFRSLYEPEWWHPVYVEKYCNFIEALGREFDGKEWLEFVDIRCYGIWGEGHRWSASVAWPSNVSKRDLIIRFIDAHLRAFKKTPLVVQTASDKDTPYPEGTAIDYALAKGCWMRRDGFGPYINDAEKRLLQGHWRHSLVIAENGGSLVDFARGRIRRWWSPGAEPITLEDLFDQMLELHCNYIPLGWGDRDWDVLRHRPELLKKLWMKMGYRFLLREATFPRRIAPGAKLKVRHTWENVGVGRLPFAYPLAFYLIDVEGRIVQTYIDGTFDETGWVAGKTHTFSHEFLVPRDAAPGTYYLAVALVDPKTRKPAIALGIEGSDGERRYILGVVRVVRSGADRGR